MTAHFRPWNTFPCDFRTIVERMDRINLTYCWPARSPEHNAYTRPDPRAFARQGRSIRLYGDSIHETSGQPDAHRKELDCVTAIQLLIHLLHTRIQGVAEAVSEQVER